MTFAWPVMLLGLLLVPLALVGYIAAQRRRARYAVRFTNLDLLANVVDRSPGWRRHLPAVLALLALALLLTGMARPYTTFAVPREEATIVLAMDASASMRAVDVEPSRLAAAREAASTFVDDLPDSMRVGVVAFSRGAYVMAAPSTDHGLARSALHALETESATAIGDGISAALESGRLAQAETTSEGDPAAGEEERPPLAILLLSDGANTMGRDPLDAAEEARERGVPIYTVALGTDTGQVTITDENGFSRTIPVPPDPMTLRAIAERTGGQSFEAPDADELRAVYDEIGSRVGYEDEEREVTVAFAGAGALLLLLGGALSALWFGRLP